MNKFKKLYETRAEKERKMQQLLAKADTENRAFSDEEKAEFDALEEAINEIDSTIACEERARKLTDAKTVVEPEKKEQTVEERAAAEEKAFADFIRGAAVENRAGEIQLTQGNNGAIVPQSIADRIIVAVRDMVPFLSLADVVTTNGKLSVPVYGEDATNHINAEYVDEGEELTDNVGKFTTIDLSGYVIGALALISNKLKDNTDIDIVNFIVQRVAASIAEKLESEFINGSEKITGITSADAVMTSAASTAVTYDELLKLKHSLKHRFRAKGRFIMSPATYTAICQLKDENGQPYFKESEYKILDVPVIESDSMPDMGADKKAIVFADLKGYTIKATKSVEISVLREKFATKNMLGVLAFCEYDAKITDAKRIAVLKMASA